MDNIVVRYSRSETWTLGEGAHAVEVRVEVDDDSCVVHLDGAEYTPDEAQRLAAVLSEAARRCEEMVSDE